MDLSGFKQVPAWIAPNRPVLALVLGGFVVESLLLGAARDNIYQSGVGLLAVLALMFWFWVTAGWVVWGLAQGTAWVTRRWPAWLRIPCSAALVALVIAGLVLYFGSWGLYLNAGQFANLASVEFVVNNTDNVHIMWCYITEAERWIAWALIAAGIGLVVVVPLFLCWLTRDRWAELRTSSTRLRWAIWLTCSFLATALVLNVWIDQSEMRRSAQLDFLGRRFNPIVTISVSGIHAMLTPRIEPCLDVAELTPISQQSWQPPAGEHPRPNILFVAVESLRHDVIDLRHQGQEVTPHLNALARDGLRLNRAYAQSTHSDYSDVTVVSSLYPLRTRRHHFYRRSDPWPKTLIYDLLKPQGYATAIVSSQNEGWGGMDQFLDSPHLDLFYDAHRSGAPTQASQMDTGLDAELRAGTLVAGKLNDNHTTDQAIAWLSHQSKAGKPFFLTMNFQSSHFPYVLAPGTAQPFQPCLINFKASFTDYPVEKTPIVRNAFYNAIHDCDRLVGRLIAALRDLGQLDNTILVVYGENGEAFHENGLVNHAQAPYEPGVHVACVIHAPRHLKAKVEEYPFELVDLTPTVLGLMGWPRHPNFQGIDALSSDRPPLDERLLYFHTENPLSRTDAVMLAGRWKLMVDRNSAKEYLFDLQEDPGEAVNLLQREPERASWLRSVLKRWRDGQLAYYHYPTYYRSYYPPQPPRGNGLPVQHYLAKQD